MNSGGARLAATVSVCALLATAFAAPAASAANGGGLTVTTKRVLATERGFDIASAPSTAQIRAWTHSGYHAVNMYFSGRQRHDPVQSALSPTWVTTVLANGWDIIPTVVDLQAPCATSTTKQTMSRNRSTAYSQGSSAASVAVAGSHNRTSLQRLGIAQDAIAYIDIEPYSVPSGDTTCVPAVLAFLNGWTTRIHALGYRSGVYGLPTQVIAALLSRQGDATFHQPDAIWFARYDGVESTSNSNIPSGYLAGHRIHQYVANVIETHNQVKLQIDRDAIGGDVVRASSITRPSSAPYTYAVSGTGAAGLRERVSPDFTSMQVGVRPELAKAPIMCQTPGTGPGATVLGDSTWDNLDDGTFVSDIYTTTTGRLGASPYIPTCAGTAPSGTMSPAPPGPVEAGTTVNLSGTFAAGGVDTISSVGFYVSRDGRTTWSSIGNGTPGLGGAYSIDYTVPYGDGTKVYVRAAVRDGEGSARTTSNVVSFAVQDTTSPTLVLNARPAWSLAPTATWSWHASDADSKLTYDVQWRRAHFMTRFGSWQRSTTSATSLTLNLAPGYDYCMQVQARDRSGNASGYSSQVCTARPADDRKLSASTSGWARWTGSRFYLGTVTGTIGYHRTLSLTGSALRLALVATACSTCGRVEVRVNGVRVGNVIDLHSSITHRRRLFTLPLLSGVQAGASIVVRTVSFGKPVQIDGIGVSRT